MSALDENQPVEPEPSAVLTPTPLEGCEVCEFGAQPCTCDKAEPQAITFGDSGHQGEAAPFTRATAVTHAEAQASAVSTRSGTPLGTDQLQRTRTDFLDAWDSRWQYP